MYRVALRRGSSLYRGLVNSHCHRSYSRCCLGNFGSRYDGNGSTSQSHRWSSSSSVAVGAEPFLSGSSGSYVEAMYESWQNDRNSVHKVSSDNQLRPGKPDPLILISNFSNLHGGGRYVSIIHYCILWV